MKNILQKISRFFKNHYCLAVLDEIKGRWIVKPEPKIIAYLKAENANGRHILIKPDPQIEPFYILADDLTNSLIALHHRLPSRVFKHGRMVVETSPGNYQVWIHSDRALTLDEKRYWLKKLHSDPGADPHNRWGRCPGFRNRKDRHRTDAGQYPLAKLIWVDWKHNANIPKIPISKVVKAVREKEIFLPHQPRGEVCQRNNFTRSHSRSHYEKGDDSATDFAYAIALFRQGFSSSEVSQKIVAERQNWKNHASPYKKEKYLNRTLTKAYQIVSISTFH